MRAFWTAILVLLLTLPSAADAKGKGKGGKAKQRNTDRTLFAGEMPQPNAHTLKQGQAQMYLGTRVSVGATDNIQINTHALGFAVLGPRAGVETAVWQTKDDAVSLTVDASTNWRFYDRGLQFLPLYTHGGHRSNRITAGLGVAVDTIDYGRIPDKPIFDYLPVAAEGIERTVSVPLLVGYDLVPSNRTVIQFWGNTDVRGPARGDPFTFQLGTSWNHAWDSVRLSAGMTLRYNALADVQGVIDSLAALGLMEQQTLPKVLPLPYVRIWWRF